MRNPMPWLFVGLSLAGLLFAAGCGRHAVPPPTPLQRQSTGLQGEIFQINQNPQLTLAQKQQLIDQVRASAARSGSPPSATPPSATP